MPRVEGLQEAQNRQGNSGNRRKRKWCLFRRAGGPPQGRCSEGADCRAPAAGDDDDAGMDWPPSCTWVLWVMSPACCIGKRTTQSKVRMRTVKISGSDPDISGAENGIRLGADIHLGSHGRFNAAVEGKLNSILAANPNILPKDAAQAVRGYADQLRAGIQRTESKLK